MASDPQWDRKMQEEKKKEDEAKKLAATLLTNIKLVHLIHMLIKRAANFAHNDKDVISNRNRTCVQVVGASARTRTDRTSAITEQYHMEYHPDDIIIIGGIAFAIYDNEILDVKERRKAKPLVEYLSKNTSDIDMVWWPRITSTTNVPFNAKKHVLTLQSPAMNIHVSMFTEYITGIFSESSSNTALLSIIKENKPDVKSIAIHINKDIKHTFGINSGVYKVMIYITITTDNDEQTIELCDISIHDGASSQKTPGERGLILDSMENDPVYCNPTDQIKHLKYFYNNNKKKENKISQTISVPIVSRLVDQQLLVFKNLLDNVSDKCIVNYNRLRYLQSILKPTNNNTEQVNKQFGIVETERAHLIKKIDDELIKIMHKSCHHHNDKDAQRQILCETINPKIYSTIKQESQQEQQFLQQQHILQQQFLQQQHQLLQHQFLEFQNHQYAIYRHQLPQILQQYYSTFTPVQQQYIIENPRSQQQFLWNQEQMFLQLQQQQQQFFNTLSISEKQKFLQEQHNILQQALMPLPVNFSRRKGGKTHKKKRRTHHTINRK